MQIVPITVIIHVACMYQVLKEVKRLPEVDGQPCCGVVDFEKAVWKAFQSVFPAASQRGCFFHYTQVVWQNVQAVGTSLIHDQLYVYYHYYLNRLTSWIIKMNRYYCVCDNNTSMLLFIPPCLLFLENKIE